MRTEVLNTLFTHGIKTKIRIADCMIGFLPEDKQQKIKSVGRALMKTTYAAMGEMLKNESQDQGQNGAMNNPQQRKINID